MRSFEVLLLLWLAAVAGCTESGSVTNLVGSIGSTPIEALVKSPEQYLGKEVQVTGNLVIGWGKAFLEDEKGYRIELQLQGTPGIKAWNLGNRMLYADRTYTISGILMSYQLCQCQSRRNITGEDWSDYSTMRVEKCEKSPEYAGRRYDENWQIVTVFRKYRCKPGTVEEKYYIEVVEVK